jgi:hypothetical protein
MWRWVGPKFGLYTERKEKFLLLPASEPQSFSPQGITFQTENGPTRSAAIVQSISLTCLLKDRLKVTKKLLLISDNFKFKNIQACHTGCPLRRFIRTNSILELHSMCGRKCVSVTKFRVKMRVKRVTAALRFTKHRVNVFL